jgi:hypothetical protein
VAAHLRRDHFLIQRTEPGNQLGRELLDEAARRRRAVDGELVNRNIGEKTDP